MGALKFHPLADAFPLIEGKDFDELVSSIKANGLRHPIIILDGMILDGRNRYRACQEAGISPLTKQFDGRDPIAFVIDENVHRRHLTIGQRAIVAAKLTTFAHGGDRSKELIGGLNQGDRSKAQHCALNQEDVASAMNVGERSVQKAALILREGTPEQIASVESGEKTINAVSEEIRPPKTPKKRFRKNTRAKTMNMKGELWSQLKAVLNGMSGLPLPSDVAAAARTHDKAGLVDKRLPHASKWLKDFEHAWNRNRDKAAA